MMGITQLQVFPRFINERIDKGAGPTVDYTIVSEGPT